jgi:2-polyprenyl-6-methoxyphenol hydroxylase-like FAD-dependent oxidoreductase
MEVGMSGADGAQGNPLRIAIIGGGIGGITAALSLLRAGADVHVYERAKTLGKEARASKSALTHLVSCIG